MRVCDGRFEHAEAIEWELGVHLEEVRNNGRTVVCDGRDEYLVG